MKITFNKSGFLPPLARAAAVAGTKTNFAVTGHVLIRATDGADVVEIEANNLETATKSQCPAVVESSGEALLDAARLLQIVKAWPQESLTIEEIENRWFGVSDRTGTVEFHLVGLDPEEFPDMTTAESDPVEIPPQALAREIQRAAVISQTPDDNRAHVAGFRIRLRKMEREEGEDTPVVEVDSTDSARMSRGKIYLGADGDDFSAIVPKKAARSLVDFLENAPAGEPVQIRASQDYISATAGPETISVRLLEGEWPRVAELLAMPRNAGFVHDGAKLAASVSRMTIMSSVKYKGQIWHLSPDQLKITATNPDMGESEEAVPVEFDGDGDGWELAWDSRYILEAIKCADGALHFDFCGPNNALKIHSEAGGPYVNIIMPMVI